MKKQLLLLMMMLLSLVASAYDIAVQNADGITIYYNYINEGKELEVTKGGYQGNVVIPDEVTYMNRARKVTSIGESAFGNCLELSSVSLGSNVTSIGEWAFSGCRGLTNIEIYNSVTSIGKGAFCFCTNLTSFSVDETNNYFKSINGVLMSKDETILVAYPPGRIETTYIIPNGVTSIGEGAFYSCDGLTSIKIPNSVISIGVDAFNQCTSLTSIEIPNSVTNIGGFAFYGCYGLKKVIVSDIAAWCSIKFGSNDANPLGYAGHLYSDENTEIKDLVIPNSVTSIGNIAFIGCFGLTSITIPSSVTSIGESAFNSCLCLTSVTIGNSVTSIGNYAFSGCSGLTSVTIPNSVTNIGKSAFYGCAGLTSVTIPNSVTSISEYTFYNCSGLTSVAIPNSVTSIGEYTFYNCSGLTSVTIPNSVTSIDGYTFLECSSLTSVTIPNNVTIIGVSAFSGCKGLASVTIGSSVKHIGQHAFHDCDIPEIISKIKDPIDINGNAFSNNTYNNATLYVPIGTTGKYKTKNGWKEFVFIEEGVPSGIEQPLSNTRQIKIENGVLTIQNIKNETKVSVYNAKGTFVGSTISQNKQAVIDTNMQPNSIAIVKIGEQSIKVIIK